MINYSIFHIYVDIGEYIDSRPKSTELMMLETKLIVIVFDYLLA